MALLEIDPRSTDTIYAGTRAGIFKSTDGGAKWRQLRSGLPENTSVNSIVISPEDSRTLYVGTASGAFRSTDIGENWSALNSGLPGGLTTVVIDPTNPNTLYATTNGGVFVITFTPQSHREYAVASLLVGATSDLRAYNGILERRLEECGFLTKTFEDEP